MPANLVEIAQLDEVITNCFSEIDALCREHYMEALKAIHGLGLTEWEKLINLQLENVNHLLNLC